MSELTSTQDILDYLCNNHKIKAVKAEFETEGALQEEIFRLKEMAKGSSLTVKIGGCEAITDMIMAKNVGANSIVAPMIETPYALNKFVKASKRILSNDTKLYINIETITGYNNIEDIINSLEFEAISGIVLGRGDLLASMEKSDDVKLMEIATDISQKMEALNKEYIIGGYLSSKTISFLNKMPYYSGFESRKIIFDSSETKLSTNISDGINKALEFEISWLMDKKELGTYTEIDNQRVKELELRLQNSKSVLTSK